MKKRNALLISTALLLLSGCSTMDNLFDDKKKKPLEGERVSVLDLQNTLHPDSSVAKERNITIPATWQNKAWPQAGGYPNHVMQNIALETGALDLVWKSSIGDGSTKRLPLNARPIAVGNAIFTLDTGLNLTAIDSSNGKRVWRTNVRKDNEKENVIAGGLCFGDDVLFVTNGYDELIALSAQDGSQHWRIRLPSPSRAAPTFLDGRVFVTTLDNRLMAFDAKSGSNLWEYTGVGETAGLLGTPSPGANGSIVVPAFSSGEVTALRVENGSVAWSDNLANVRQYGGGLESLSDIKAMPVLYRGLVIAISFSGKMAAIDEATGMRIWQKDINGSETPWVSGDTVYVISADNQLAALSISDGAVLWVINLPRYEDPEDSKGALRWMGPVMVNNALLVTASNGDILSILPTSGQIKGNVRTKMKLSQGPMISGGRFYLLSDSGVLAAYR